jgi:hypothetical protein
MQLLQYLAEFLVLKLEAGSERLQQLVFQSGQDYFRYGLAPRGEVDDFFDACGAELQGEVSFLLGGGGEDQPCVLGGEFNWIKR